MENPKADIFAIKTTVLRNLTQAGGTGAEGHPQIQTSPHVTMCPCTITCGAVSCICAVPQ